MTMNQDVIIARIIAASKDIFTCEKAIVTLKDIYHSAIRQYLLKNGDPRANCGSLSPEKPEYEGVIKYTKPHYRALMKKKRELYNAHRRHRRATQALLKYQSKKTDE
ncbi:hypothetical protein [Arsenophonus sp.]|uniref:hypothetical protein n=1 Tax=Arsenophonus sp. TaxID=1872640 RepID=UPI0028618AC3|nr:hypothetical protein [Arsenophonus sp.]MDR5616805.1 hypothetical protein [Arsenophonus sp.]MDR5618329.1 hypothetical protein [Arsenophonus sp.]